MKRKHHGDWHSGELIRLRADLASARGGERIFASLSTLATLMKRIGSPKFTVDADDFTPGRVRAAQPERSAAMKAGTLPKAAAK